jgi:hypothetical protein
MAASNLIYDATVGRQNADNTVFNFVKNFDATNNAVVTGNTFKFASDRDRMAALLGAKGTPANAGYFDFLYTRIYSITVTDPVVPSINGPGGSGWGSQLAEGAFHPVVYNDEFFQKKANRSELIGVVVSGYVYVPIATTGQFQTISDDGVLVNVNGVNVINNWTYHGPTTDTSAVVTLNTGYNPISIFYFEGAGGAILDFKIKIGSGPFTNNLKCICYHNYAQL